MQNNETMKILDLNVKSVEQASQRCVLIKLSQQEPLPADICPGQFLQVRIDDVPQVLLRRPISICKVDRQKNELWLLVACVGNGTRRLAHLRPGERLNCVLPLGNRFVWSPQDKHVLLVGGGVGVAPLLYLGSSMAESKGPDVTFLLGARTQADLLLLSEFERYGRVLVTTEDGTMGERGFVTQHSVLQTEHFDRILTCGPTPMMKAVARYATQTDTDCQASLENLMACGLGACLCCVEKVRDLATGEVHNLCVCKDGPVFDTRQLLW